MINSHDTSQPLFLYLAHEAVHSALAHQPMQAPQDLIDKFKDSIQDENRRVFAAMATALDQSVGKVNCVKRELFKTGKLTVEFVALFNLCRTDTQIA